MSSPLPEAFVPRPVSPLMASLSPTALDLLAVIIRERPRSVAELARLTGRAGPNVTRSLKTLNEFGLIRLVRRGPITRPEPIASALRVNLLNATYETVPLEGEAV